MKIEEILRDKGHDVVTITEYQSVRDAVQVLVDRLDSYSKCNKPPDRTPQRS